MNEDLSNIPGFQFVDHVAIAVRQGELDAQVKQYGLLGFREIHREEVYGGDQVREALLRVGDGPNLVQLLEPLSADSPVQKLIDKNGGRGGLAHVAFRVRNAQTAFHYMKESRFPVDRQSAAPGFARHHRVFRASEVARCADRNRGGSRRMTGESDA